MTIQYTNSLSIHFSTTKRLVMADRTRQQHGWTVLNTASQRHGELCRRKRRMHSPYMTTGNVLSHSRRYLSPCGYNHWKKKLRAKYGMLCFHRCTRTSVCGWPACRVPSSPCTSSRTGRRWRWSRHAASRRTFSDPMPASPTTTSTRAALAIEVCSSSTFSRYNLPAQVMRLRR